LIYTKPLNAPEYLADLPSFCRMMGPRVEEAWHAHLACPTLTPCRPSPMLKLRRFAGYGNKRVIAIGPWEPATGTGRLATKTLCPSWPRDLVPKPFTARRYSTPRPGKSTSAASWATQFAVRNAPQIQRRADLKLPFYFIYRGLLYHFCDKGSVARKTPRCADDPSPFSPGLWQR